MENQHQKITGYRDLSQQEIDLINEIKAGGKRLHELAEKLGGLDQIDQRWMSIGVTHLQIGIMAFVRAVEQPESF